MTLLGMLSFSTVCYCKYASGNLEVQTKRVMWSSRLHRDATLAAFQGQKVRHAHCKILQNIQKHTTAGIRQWSPT
ncbi:hypothetical protein T440DRAFT_65923 [Plenodomus tracheiphilus IPT5]|uniref:Uncharacterized protein n=1 Tax=Plenodomus tracheiphilus IPT5 TaxID=1408161 RepID=A0A6A7B7X0_9PLEO|nr:hypothetical protein T440DRAFT_65923 [Plenodomus tracheiphilus IPT5]